MLMGLHQGGIEQTALHNHVLGGSPRLLYMHISGRGDGVTMAETTHVTLTLSNTPFSAPAGGAQL